MAKNQGSKGCPKPKKTPSFARYKNENRAYHHQVKQMQKHIAKNPNDMQTINRLDGVRQQFYNRLSK